MSEELELPICIHIKANGDQCQLAAMHGRRYCHFHDETEKRRRASARLTRRLANRARRTVNIPVLEDANSVQVALMETIHGLIDQRLDHKDASLIFYALQTASANVRNMRLEPKELDVRHVDWLKNRISRYYDELAEYRRWEERERCDLRSDIEKKLRAEFEAKRNPPPAQVSGAAPTSAACD